MDRNEWRKSSYSIGSGQCVEACTAWRTSSYSVNGGQCVELATDRPVVLVRDSKDPAGPVLRVSPAGWARFTAAIKHADGPAATVAAGLS